jgi:cellulose biosynthesis protein BcsQ
MAEFLTVSNRKGGVGKSTIAVMLAHAAALWSGRGVLVLDLDTQCNASLMLIGGEAWEKASRAGRTIADYIYDRFDRTAADEAEYLMNNVGDVRRGWLRSRGRLSLLAGSQRLEEIQGELYLSQSKKDLDADAVAVRVRARIKRLLRHFGMDFDLVVLDCPPGLSFAALAAIDLADRVLVPFRPDFVSPFAVDRVALLIERVETLAELASIPFGRRRYACLANGVTGAPQERLLREQLAVDHPVLATAIPLLDSIAHACDWDASKKSMEQKYADALPCLRALHAEVFPSRAAGAREARAL